MGRKIRVGEDLKNQPLDEHEQDQVDEPEPRVMPKGAIGGGAKKGEPALFGGKQAPPFTGGRPKKRKVQVGKREVHGGRRPFLPD